MRFRLEFPDPRVVCRIEASGAADLLFGILDRITIDLPMLRPPDQKPTGEVVVRLSVKHTHPRCEVYLDVWRGVLPTEPARLGEYLEGEADDCPSRAESLWLRAVTVRLDEIRKGTVPGPRIDGDR